MIAILIVDDHPLVTERLEGRLRAEHGFGPVLAAHTLGEARKLLAETRFDIVVCDVRLPDGSGLELLAEARATLAGPRFLMLSQYDHPLYQAAAQRHGAGGYLLKTTRTDAIVDAVRRVHAGGWVYPADPGGAAWAPLTDRERQVLAGLLRGQTNDEIASDLGLSRKTVEVHLSHLFTRAGALSRTELALRVEREGWLDIPPEPRPRR